MVSRRWIPTQVLLLLLATAVGVIYAKTGVDLSIKVTTAQWASLFPTPATERNFAIVHGYFYNNTVNPNALSSLKSAWNAGVVDLSVYFYPCHPASTFVHSTNITCPSAVAQMDNFLTTLRASQISFFNSSNHANASALQSNPYLSPSIWNKSRSAVVLNRLFINLEDTVPNQYFSQQHYENVQFLDEMVSYTKSFGIDTGVYTTVLDWNNIMTDVVHKKRVYYHTALSNSATNPFSHLKLWTPRFDQVEDMSYFAPFAGWNATLVKQMSGGAKEARRIGSARVCTDFIADSASTVESDT